MFSQIFISIKIKMMLSIGIVIVLTLGMMFYWMAKSQESHIIRQVHTQAKTLFDNAVLTRAWVAKQGGVFVEKRGHVETNMYLSQIQGLEVDIETIDNKVFTLRNPALVTRELSELGIERGEAFKLHITSLRPINPNNSPIKWETKALQSFEQGMTESAIIDTEDSVEMYRYMAPLITTDACLQCHVHQGYQVGDVRGGISVSIPMTHARVAITHMRWQFLLIGMGTTSAVLLILFGLTHYLVLKPLQKVEKTANQISNGSLGEQVLIRTYDEFDSLANSFNHMTNQLNQLLQNLEKLVKERTQSLEESIESVQRELMERERVEHELRKLSGAVEQSSASIVITDTQGIIEYVNPSFTQTTGYTQEEVLGRKPSILKSGYHPLEYYQNLWRTLKEGKQWQGEFCNRKKDGELYWVFGSLSPIRDKNGVVMHFVAVNENTTERKLSREKIRKQKEFFNNVIESLAYPFCVINVRDYTIQIANKAAHSMGRAGSNTCHALTHSQDTPCDSFEHPCPLKEVLKTKKPFVVEHIHFDKNDNPLNVEVHCFPIFNQDGEVEQVIEYSIDITERKQAQEALRHANEKLARLNADKDKFFSIVAHDLRGPFQPLLGGTEFLVMIADKASPKEIKKVSQDIYDSAHNAYKLLENLLTWARMQRGVMTLEPTMINLHDIVKQTVTLLNTNAQDKKIILTCDVAKHIFVYADKHMLNTVIRNLTSNAIKFTPNGGDVVIAANPTPTLPLQKGEKREEDSPASMRGEEISHATGTYVEVHVKDTGIGMSQGDIQKLFRLDVHHTTQGTDKETGTGLGLILCQEMVEKHGGTIWVESTLGEGTTIKFTIPT